MVVVGEHLGADAIAAGIALNQKLGSLGKLQKFVAEADSELGDVVSLAELVKKVNAGEIDSLLVLGGNPVYSAPGDVNLRAAIDKIENTIYLGELRRRNGGHLRMVVAARAPIGILGRCCRRRRTLWSLPASNIYRCSAVGRSSKYLAVMLGDRETDGESSSAARPSRVAGASLSERQWRQLLHDGYSDDVKVSPELLSNASGKVELVAAAPHAMDPAAINQDDIEVLFTVADGVYDGRFANNGWLQELPQSLTKLTWDNAAMMSPKTAEKLEVRARFGGRSASRRQHG